MHPQQKRNITSSRHTYSSHPVAQAVRQCSALISRCSQARLCLPRIVAQAGRLRW